MYDFLLLASVVLFAASCVAFLRHPAASLFHPASFYLAFHGFIFVFRPLLARYYDYDLVYRLYGFQPSIEDKITVILSANLAMVVFVAISIWIAGERIVPVGRSEFDKIRRDLARPALLAIAILTPLALWSQIGNWERRVNNFESMVRDAATGNLINIQGNGWFTDSALMMAPMAVILVWLFRYRWWGWVYFAGFAVLQAGTGTRQALVFAVVSIAIIRLIETQRRWFSWSTVLPILLAGVAFNLLVIDRGSAVRMLFSDDLGPDYVSNEDLDPLEHMDFANLEYFEYIVYAVPQRTGSYDYFAHVLQLATEPIPRALWADKPVGSPVQYFSLWDYGQPIGMTASVPGMGWMSLGYAGVAIQAAIFALIFGFLYRFLLINRLSVVARLAYALAISLSILGFRDGTLLTLFRLAPFYFGPLLLTLLLARFAGFGWHGTAHDRSEFASRDFLDLPPVDRRRALAAQARGEAG